MRKLTLLAAAAFAATAVPASATITIGTQSAGQGQTVQFNPPTPDGATIFGYTNQTNTSVTFTSLTGQTLHGTDAQGQSRVEAYLNGTQVPLTSIDISLTTPNTTFDYAEFNMTNAGSPGDAIQVTVTGIDQFGNTFSQNYGIAPGDPTLGNGQNFVSFLASDGEHITHIQFNNTGNSGFTDLRQLRINGITGITPVPEPATWAMMLVGFGAAGVAMRRTRRRKPLLAQIA